jgi:hypothetical protein
MISIEIHFTTLYMADLGTRAEPLSEGAQAGKGEGEDSGSEAVKQPNHTRQIWLTFVYTQFTT